MTTIADSAATAAQIAEAAVFADMGVRVRLFPNPDLDQLFPAAYELLTRRG